MIKIIGILSIVLLTTSVFGQRNYCDLSDIEKGDWSTKSNLVHFTTEYSGWKHFYILAYEPNYSTRCMENSTRNIYLYTYLVDAPYERKAFIERARWIKACSDIILTPYYIDSQNNLDVDFKVNGKYAFDSHSSVIVDGNTVTFTLDMSIEENGDAREVFKEIVLERVKNRTSDGFYYKLKND